MNTRSQTPRTPTAIVMPCPWCDAPVAVEDAFATSAMRCPACATVVDLEPVEPDAATLAAAA